MPYTSFSDVGRLDANALKALLVAGEPAERVWAAWALGLLHDEAFARDLRATAAEEPHPGVRRHLIIILAGAGEHRSVLTMAAHDPDERVRATALQYLARLARPGDDEATDLLARTLATGAPLLQLGCVAGLRPDAPVGLWRAAEDCIASPDRDLRWTAYESVIRQGAHTRAASEIARDLIAREPEQTTRRDAMRLLHDRVGPAALRQLANDPALNAGLLPELVETLHERDVRLTFGEIDGLMARFQSQESLHRVLQLLVPGSEGSARAFLLRLFVELRAPSWSQLREEILTRLRRALDDNRAPLDEEERRLHRALQDFVENTVAEARANPDGVENNEDVGVCEHEREILARLAPLEVH